VAILSLGACSAAQELIVDTAPSHVANKFSPVLAFGAAVDRVEMRAADNAFAQPMLNEILGAGWQVVTYRQNTELEAEAWHWNNEGKWSDASDQGYFVGQAIPSATSLDHSYGYALPHRGTTMDSEEQGFHYSKLTDGDLDTYWKSNPYLSRHFTGEDDSLLPQWVILDLGSMQDVNAVRIAWAEPYATEYRIQFWTAGERSPRHEATSGIWQSFARGIAHNARGGTVMLPLTDIPVSTRYLRIWMTSSSNTCDSHGSSDVRNCVGYAIREIYAGYLNKEGSFVDVTLHMAGPGQSRTICSSVDPWHKASDIVKNGREQIGFDRFFKSGITRGLPAMVPIAMIYNTPEDAAAELAYLEQRHYSVSYVEMGEEPDGQYMQPEDYAALYLQFAAALHKVDPKLKLGGPSFEGVNEDIEVWPTPDGRVSWLGRFIDYIKAHGRISDLAFMSFEHYPYECASKWDVLYREPELITHILEVWRNDGVPANVPLMMTEGNMSAGSGGIFPDIMGALWLADFEGSFFTAGGSAAYFFHYIPEPMWRGCDAGGGTFSALQVDKDFHFKGPLSQYFAAQLITREWAEPVDEQHELFRVSSNLRSDKGAQPLTAYALLRPDKQWALLIVNRDRDQAYSVKVTFRQEEGTDAAKSADEHFTDTVTQFSFGSAEYQWHNHEENSYADPDSPPGKMRIAATPPTRFDIPKASIVVLRGTVK
jgi:F5/8 type C domain